MGSRDMSVGAVLWAHDRAESDVAHSSVDHLRTSRCRPVSLAVVVGAEERAALDHTAGNGELWLGAVVARVLAGPSWVGRYAAGLVGLGATVRTNKREIPADSFFTDLFETALDDGEIVTAVSFPVPDGAAYQKFASPASRYAIVGVMASQGSAAAR